MKKASKYTALTAVVCCLLLAGCRVGEASPQPLQAADEPRQKKVLMLSVQDGISEAARQGIDCFTEKVAEISENSLELQVRGCEDVIAALDEGSGLAFGSNEEFARANGDFLIYSSPYYFTDYNHLTMTLNSPQFFDLIEDANQSLMGAAPIGAFYDGSYYIISSRDEMYDTLDQFDGRTINILEGQPLLEAVIEELGGHIRERELDYMLSNFGKNRNIAAMECEIALLGDITEREKVESFHICRSFHRAKINWMMLSHQARETLDEYELAVLTEAMAYAIAKNDGKVLSDEEQSLETAYKMGGEITAPNYWDFSEFAANTLSGSERYGSLWDWLLFEEVQELALKS